MTRISLLNSPFLLGFEQVERTLDRIAKTSGEGYPPYNIEQTGEDGLRITLAVAGFGRDDLSIQLEDNQLVIRGKQRDDQERVYLHRGIAARQFQRSFVLVDGIEVVGADMDNGLLHIDLKRPVPELRVRTIEIKAPDKAKRGPIPTLGGQAGGGQAGGSQTGGSQTGGPETGKAG
jgi:HSP20 family molecular chaperone IbpA